MSRRHYVYRRQPDGEMVAVEVVTDRDVAPRVQISVEHYEGLRATDGADISSKAKHREYMRINGLTTADDYKETWAKAAEQRAAYFTDGGGAAEHKERREQLGRAFYEAERRKR